MPITAQCRSCAARYQVVDSAAGRRVKCRRCGKPMKLAGAEPVATPTVDLRALADLERKGQILAPTPEQEFQQYKATVAQLARPDEQAASKKKDFRSISDLASPDVQRKLNKDKEAAAVANQAVSALGSLLTVVGGLIFVLGAFLWIGNVSHLFYSFPFAGYITMTLGGAILGAGRKL